MRFRQLALLPPSRESEIPTLMGPLHEASCITKKLCFFNQNGTMAYNLHTHTHTHTHTSGQYHTLNLVISCLYTTGGQIIHKNIRYTKYRQYFCATPYIPLDFKRVRKIYRSDYLLRNVCLPVWNSPSPGRIFIKFDTCVFFKSRSGKFKFH